MPRYSEPNTLATVSGRHWLISNRESGIRAAVPARVCQKMTVKVEYFLDDVLGDDVVQRPGQAGSQQEQVAGQTARPGLAVGQVDHDPDAGDRQGNARDLPEMDSLPGP